MSSWLARSVAKSDDLQRILDLPRREVTDEYLAQYVEQVTEEFLTDLGRREGATLRPAQAAGLVELYENRGGYLGYPVGTGKELTIALAALALGAERAVLCTPAGLKRQTLDDWARYSRHWKIPSPPPRIISYEELTDEPKVDLLDRLNPDLLLLNEADVLRNPSASMVKRIDRFRIAHWDDCDVVALTGTPGRLSVLDFWHILVWCLRERAPVPLHHAEAEMWAAAIDERPAFRAGMRPGVGALRELGGEGPTVLDRARDGFRQRLTQTPGVIILSVDSCDQPLAIRQVLAPIDPVIEGHFDRFRTLKETPGGERLSDPLSYYRHASELGAGYYSVFDPPPPEAWRDARRSWHTFVDEVIEASAASERPLDTEAAVARAYPRAWQYLAWREIKGTYTTPSKPVWLSDSVVEFVLEYLDAADARGEPTLAFIWSIPLAEACEWLSLERAKAGHGAPRLWYGRKGMTRSGAYIGKADATRSAILSGGANLRGRNLQAFSHNLFVTPPQSARFLEQALGRTHRQGQADAVTTTWLITSGETADGFERAVAEAEFGKATWATSQKLLSASIQRIPENNWPQDTFRFARHGSTR